MKLQELGEFNFIERIRPRFTNVPEGTVGIGDDCAVIALSDNKVQLITTDLLVENIHFLRDCITPADLGYKSMAVNISDIAAMGGTPTGVFLSIALPGNMDISWCDSFFDGIHSLVKECDCPLLGGDTTKTRQDIAINITVLGEMNPAHVKYRSGAQAGDIMAVTGTLGDSAAGLRLILQDMACTSDQQLALLQAHNRPAPQVEAGCWLARQPAVQSMMDVSDGIDSDIRHIMKASNVGAAIDLARIPLSDALRQVAHENGWPAEELALTGGEDYVLLCTIRAEAFTQLAQAFEQRFKSPLYPIGCITDTGQLNYERSGVMHHLKTKGFDHFKSS